MFLNGLGPRSSKQEIIWSFWQNKGSTIYELPCFARRIYIGDLPFVIKVDIKGAASSMRTTFKGAKTEKNNKKLILGFLSIHVVEVLNLQISTYFRLKN